MAAPSCRARADRLLLLSTAVVVAACVPSTPLPGMPDANGGARPRDGATAGIGGAGGIGGYGTGGTGGGGSGGAGGGSGGSGGARADAARPADAPRPPADAPRAPDSAAPTPGKDAGPSTPDAPPANPGPACNPGGSGFDTATTGVALDRKTCLAWERGDPQRDVSKCPLMIRDNPSKLCFDEAVRYCQSLRLDGRSDWRLPTIDELKTLVVAGMSPTIDKATFTEAVLSLYWSSQKLGEKIVCIDFSNAGTVNDHIGPDGPQAFRCVRGPLPPR